MNGKEKCRALKEIRRQIAEKNDIPYAVSQCTHQGNCKGTCPKCEAELRYLEKELALRKSLGKAVAVAGISLAAFSGLTACGISGTGTSQAGTSQTGASQVGTSRTGTSQTGASQTGTPQTGTSQTGSASIPEPAGGNASGALVPGSQPDDSSSQTLPETSVPAEPAPQDEYMGELPEDLVMGEILPASYTIEGDISLQEEPDISGGDSDSREVPSFVE